MTGAGEEGRIDTLEASSRALLRELRLSDRQAYIGFGGDRWLVVIFGQRKRPAIIRWAGLPVEYEIGLGEPVPFGLQTGGVA